MSPGRGVGERAAVPAGLDALDDERVGPGRARRRASAGVVTVTQTALPAPAARSTTPAAGSRR